MATTARPAPRAATTEQAARAKTAPTAARDPMRDLNRAPMLAPMPDPIHASSVRRAMIAPRAPMARARNAMIVARARTLPAHPATTAPRARRNSLKRLARPATKSTTSSWATTSSTTPRAAAPKAARRLVMATVAAVAADAAVGDRNRAELGRQTHHDLNHVMRRQYSEACVR